MSFDVDWDVNNYEEENETEEQWRLRRKFMERWKRDYSEERLVCLSRVFANMEFMGCRYPSEVMQEVSRMSHEIVQSYRGMKKTKLQRTFVSASDAAADRAQGIKREGGVIKDATPRKLGKIMFVKPGQSIEDKNNDSSDSNEEEVKIDNDIVKETVASEQETTDPLECRETKALHCYLNEMALVKCIDVKLFRNSMFNTKYGPLVLLIRPWTPKLMNIQASCQICNVKMRTSYEDGCYSAYLNDELLASATGSIKSEAKSNMETIAFNRLKQETVSLLVKEQWMAEGRIGPSDVAGPREDQFGTPLESTVAIKMMKMMGWQGGGLGADAQGIEEPIKPNLQMVNRAGLGSSSSDPRQLRSAAASLMHRFRRSEALDVDLVFSSEFSKEERAALHQAAKKAGLLSRSYGRTDRFLVVRKKIDPFSLVHAVIEKGGSTPKYQVYIPAALHDRHI